MRALTHQAPWGSLVACGRKPWENRKPNVATPRMVGEVVAIHQGLAKWSKLATGDHAPDGLPWPRECPYGVVLAVAEVMEIVGPDERLDDPWRIEGLGGIRFGILHVLHRPIFCPGFVGWWTLPPSIEVLVRAQTQ